MASETWFEIDPDDGTIWRCRGKLDGPVHWAIETNVAQVWRDYPEYGASVEAQLEMTGPASSTRSTANHTHVNDLIDGKSDPWV